MLQWLLRKRVPSEPVATGANSRVLSQPMGGPALPTVITSGPKGLYHFHQGDIFTPGANNWALEYPFEYPVFGAWGAGGGNQGVFRMANTWKIRQPPQVYINQTQSTVGLGGLQAGQFMGAPLLDNDSQGGGG